MSLLFWNTIHLDEGEGILLSQALSALLIARRMARHSSRYQTRPRFISKQALRFFVSLLVLCDSLCVPREGATATTTTLADLRHNDDDDFDSH